MTEELKTPDEWCEITGIKVVDPDGWDRKDPQSWYTPITRDDFMCRAMNSSCTAWPWPLKDEAASRVTWDELRVTPFSETSMTVQESSPLLDSALAMFELFTTLVQAGFNERQALILVAESVMRGRQ